MADELIDIVDEANNVIGTAPRKGIHKTELMHRSVHIFLVNQDGRIWLEKRAQSTDTFPGYYNSSAAGHVSKGESYLEAAKREALEELGIEGLDLKQKHLLKASKETSNEFVAFFVTKSETKPVKHEATDTLEPYSIGEIDNMMTTGCKFVPIFVQLFEWYKENMLSFSS